jgi:uncharacterized integral membrane protein
MKGLKVIPVFVILLLCTYLGILFVEANRENVVVSFGKYQSTAMPLGLVILTSVLVGMVAAGALCSIELVILLLQNQKLKRRQARMSDASSYNTREEMTTTNFDLKTGDKEPVQSAEEPNKGRFSPL